MTSDKEVRGGGERMSERDKRVGKSEAGSESERQGFGVQRDKE